MSTETAVPVPPADADKPTAVEFIFARLHNVTAVVSAVLMYEPLRAAEVEDLPQLLRAAADMVDAGIDDFDCHMDSYRPPPAGLAAAGAVAQKEIDAWYESLCALADNHSIPRVDAIVAETLSAYVDVPRIEDMMALAGWDETRIAAALVNAGLADAPAEATPAAAQ